VTVLHRGVRLLILRKLLLEKEKMFRKSSIRHPAGQEN
jgi:hypothetical protein